MKRIVWLLTIITVIVAGCSDLTGENPTQQQKKDIQKKELTIVMPQSNTTSDKNRITAFQKHAKWFEETNQGVTVTFVLLPLEKYHDSLLQHMAEKKPMDLVFGNYDSDISYKGAYADLLPLFRADRMTTDDVYKPLVDSVTVNGKLIGIPMSPDLLLVYYHRSWFDKANLPMPDANWNWDQFFNISAKLKDANTVQGQEVLGSALPLGDVSFLETLVATAGSSFLSPDGSTVSGYLDNPAVAQAIANLLKEINNGKVIKQIPNPNNAMLTELRSGNVGMGVGKSLLYSFLLNSKEWYGDLGVVSLPRSERGERFNSIYTSTLSIATSSKEQSLAWKFMREIVLNPESGFQQDWAKQELLTSKAAVQKLKLIEDSRMKVIYGEMEYAVIPAIYRNPKLRGVGVAAVLRKLLTATSLTEVQNALTEAANSIDKQLGQVK